MSLIWYPVLSCVMLLWYDCSLVTTSVITSIATSWGATHCVKYEMTETSLDRVHSSSLYAMTLAKIAPSKDRLVHIYKYHWICKTVRKTCHCSIITSCDKWHLEIRHISCFTQTESRHCSFCAGVHIFMGEKQSMTRCVSKIYGYYTQTVKLNLEL